jgi:hypothetical protein
MFDLILPNVSAVAMPAFSKDSPEWHRARGTTLGASEVARAIGEINRACGRRGGTTLLAGPGRWGTSTPSLGVPVKFSEINHIAALHNRSTPRRTSNSE